MEYLAVPWLRSGTGDTPEEGGCIMQVVDWIDSGGWSDDPACVHPLIQQIAINANDRLDDKQRQKLLDLAPRLMGTSLSGLPISKQVEVTQQLFNFAYRRIRGGAYAREHAIAEIGDNPRIWRVNSYIVAEEFCYVLYSRKSTGKTYLAVLCDVLDEFDRLTGRTKVEQIDWAPVCEVMQPA